MNRPPGALSIPAPDASGNPGRPGGSQTGRWDRADAAFPGRAYRDVKPTLVRVRPPSRARCHDPADGVGAEFVRVEGLGAVVKRNAGKYSVMIAPTEPDCRVVVIYKKDFPARRSSGNRRDADASRRFRHFSILGTPPHSRAHPQPRLDPTEHPYPELLPKPKSPLRSPALGVSPRTSLAAFGSRQDLPKTRAQHSRE